MMEALLLRRAILSHAAISEFPILLVILVPKYLQHDDGLTNGCFFLTVKRNTLLNCSFFGRAKKKHIKKQKENLTFLK